MSDNSITIGIRDLRAAVQRAAAVTERRNTIPILDCLRIRRDGSEIVVRGDDLDIAIDARVPFDSCTSAQPFDVAVYARPLLALLGAMPGHEVRLTPQEGRLRITSDAGLSARLTTQPVADFPEPRVVEAAPVTLDGTQFREALARLMPAVSDGETRYYLNGIYFEVPPSGPEIRDRSLLMTATNGHVMHMTAIAAEGDLPPPDFILHRKACKLLMAMVGDAPVTLIAQEVVTERTVTIDNGKDPKREEVRKDRAVRLAFQTRAGTLTTRDIDGTFPDYRRVIPKETNAVMTIEGRALRGAVQAVTAISSDAWRGVKIEGIPGVGVVLRTAHPDNGEAKMPVSCGWVGDRQELGVSAAYLTQALQRFRAPEVRIGITDGAAPMLMTSAGTDAGSAIQPGEFRAVIMPMRI